MKWNKNKTMFLLMALLGFLMLSVSVWDIVFEEGWHLQILAGYMVLILFTLILLVVKLKKKSADTIISSVKEFEKTLEGKLFHFQCPSCHGIFAIKKSKHNNKKPIKLTCPDCGTIGIIPSTPKSIKARIPDQKSPNVIFKCIHCEEKITMWAEGTELYKDVHVFSCPYCEEEQSMKRI